MICDHPVEVEEGDEEAVEQFQPVVDLADAGAAAVEQHLDLESEPGGQRLPEAHHARSSAGVEDVEVQWEADLEVGQAVEAFEQQLRVDGAAARLQHDAHLLVAFVAHVGQDRQLLVGDQIGDLLDQLALLDAVRNLADQQVPAAALFLLDADRGAQAEAAAPRGISQSDRLAAVDQHAAGREVGAADEVHQRRILGMRIVDQLHGRVGQLGDIVRRDAGRHADGDAAGAVGEQVREQAGEDLGLFLLAIIGRLEVDRALVEPGHHLRRHRRQLGLGVAVGGGIIAVDVAEIALAVDERIAQRPVLRQADHGVIDRLVAVRMIFADDVADDPRALLVAAGRVELEQPHGPQQPAVDRLQPVADVRQRAGGDRRQGIDEVALGKRRVERRVDGGRGKIVTCMARGLATPSLPVTRHVHLSTVFPADRRRRREEKPAGLGEFRRARFLAVP